MTPSNITTILPSLILATSTSLVVMLVAFFCALKFDFYSLVDAVWSYCFALIALVLAVASGILDARFVFYAMIMLWSVRLGTHLSRRLLAHFPTEDTRYITLRMKWAGHLKSRFALFFLIQGVSLIVLSLPLVVVSSDSHVSWGVIPLAALGLWLFGIAFEATADAQLSAFKKDPTNKGRVCDVGLWRYSRHPNYFGEWVIWCSYGLFALGSPFGIVALIAPVAIFVLLNFVSGIPLAEEQSLKSRGDHYVAYQRQTSKFFPWFPKAE
jgi:steroid 5-alpha reductase family enzyme